MRKIHLFIARAWPCPKNRKALYIKPLQHPTNIGYILLVLMVALFNTNVKAQGLSKPNTLLVGDKVPNLVLEKTLNHKDSTATLSAFRGKALILDFWATYCTACLKEFPKMDSLQNHYGKNLQILLINTYEKDDENILRRFIEARKARGSFNLAVVQTDATLRKVFPVKSMPHYIWIGADGRIKAITGAAALTGAPIERLIAGLSLNLNTKTN